MSSSCHALEVFGPIKDTHYSCPNNSDPMKFTDNKAVTQNDDSEEIVISTESTFDDECLDIPGNGWSSRNSIQLDGSSVSFESKVTHTKYQTITYRPDTLLDGWATDYCTIRAASLRGTSHRCFGQPRQDDLTIKVRDDLPAIIITVADGVSNASHSHIASTVATRYISQRLCKRESFLEAPINWDELMRDASDAIVDHMSSLSTDMSKKLCDIHALVATTIISAVIYPSQINLGSLSAEVCCVGDSGAWILQEGRILPILGGKQKVGHLIYDEATDCLPQPRPKPSIKRLEISKDSVFLIGTDGFGDPLGDGTCQVGRLYSSVLSRRIPSIIEFGHMLDFTLATFFDDRTLVAVWPNFE